MIDSIRGDRVDRRRFETGPWTPPYGRTRPRIVPWTAPRDAESPVPGRARRRGVPTAPPDGGFAYTAEADGDLIVADRYGWALAEGIGAAAALHERATAHGDADAAERFGAWHARFVEFVDDYRGPAGLWYENRPAPGEAGEPVAPDPPGVEPDYHPASAYFESRRSFKRTLENE